MNPKLVSELTRDILARLKPGQRRVLIIQGRNVTVGMHVRGDWLAVWKILLNAKWQDLPVFEELMQQPRDYGVNDVLNAVCAVAFRWDVEVEPKAS